MCSRNGFFLSPFSISLWIKHWDCWEKWLLCVPDHQLQFSVLMCRHLMSPCLLVAFLLTVDAKWIPWEGGWDSPLQWEWRVRKRNERFLTRADKLIQQPPQRSRNHGWELGCLEPLVGATKLFLITQMRLMRLKFYAGAVFLRYGMKRLSNPSQDFI